MEKFFAASILSVVIASISTLANAETTASMTKQAAPASEFSQWKAGYANYLNGPAFKEAKSSSINHYFEVGRKIGTLGALTGVARYDSTRTIGGSDSETLKGNHYLKLASNNLIASEANSIKAQLRYGFPTSEASKNDGLDFYLQPRAYIDNAYRKFSLSTILIPTFYSYDTRTDGQKAANATVSSTLSYNFSKYGSIDFGVEPGWDFVRGQDAAYNNLPIYPGFTANVTDKISISPYLEYFVIKPQRKTTSIGAFVNAVVL